MNNYAMVAALFLAATACDSQPTTPVDMQLQASVQAEPQSVKGKGSYDLGGTPVAFDYDIKQKQNGGAEGSFSIHFTDSGFTYDIAGQATCLAVDPVNHRAWVGGVVTRNNSTDPDLQTTIHQPGRDVWFRVLDGGSGPAAGDRTSFFGFEGGGGIVTSSEYCAARLWAANNARTWAVTEGKIKVKP